MGTSYLTQMSRHGKTHTGRSVYSARLLLLLRLVQHDLPTETVVGQMFEYLLENTGDEECPGQVAQQNAESLAPAEGVQLMSEKHAQHGVLVLRPLAKVAPFLQRLDFALMVIWQIVDRDSHFCFELSWIYYSVSFAFDRRVYHENGNRLLVRCGCFCAGCQ